MVWIPKGRRKILYGQLRKYLGQIFKDLAHSRECEVLEGHMMSDHVHMLISIPPKYSVSQVVGYIKGKSAIHVARNYLGKRRNYTGQQFWARGYHVSTVGRDESTIREYIRSQEQEDQRLDQLNLFKKGSATFEVAHKLTALSGSHLQATGSAGGMVTLFEMVELSILFFTCTQRSIMSENTIRKK